MEFRLNKVDVEIRQKVKDTTKDGIVHAKEGNLVDTDQSKQEKKKLDWDNEEKKIEEHNAEKNSKIIIKAVKSTIEDEIEVNVYKEYTDNKETDRGVFLDTRK